MKDMRAAGFEPINVISQYKWQDGLGYYESTKDASTNFFFDFLPTFLKYALSMSVFFITFFLTFLGSSSWI